MYERIHTDLTVESGTWKFCWERFKC